MPLHDSTIKTEAGQRWELPCAFHKFEDDFGDVTWQPGDYENQYTNHAHDGIGLEIREVIAVVDLPSPYQKRVFYQRKWRAPDGYEFGKNRALCIALPAFNAWRANGPSWNRQWLNGGAVLAESAP